MIYLKLFDFPTPKELGMSNNNHAMPSRMFPNNDTEKTWEDYDEYLQKHYPVKYFLAAALPGFFLRVWCKLSRPFKDAHYWLVSHLVPSRRYHMLDLRQPRSDINDIDSYTWGYLETDQAMLYSIFNLLNTFFQQQLPNLYCPSEEDAAKDDGIDYNYGGFKRQRANYLEIITIHQWWNVDRKLDANRIDELHDTWWSMRTTKSPEAEKAWEELRTAKEEFDNKEDEMIERLMKIRRSLWT